MTIVQLRRAGFGLAACVSLVLPSLPAQATAVTVGSHYVETSTRRSVNVPSSATCNDSFFCYILFNVIPSGKQLLVTQVDCQVNVTGANSDNLFMVKLMNVLPNSGGESDRRAHFVPTVARTFSATHVLYAVNAPTRQLFKTGERPVIQFNTNESGNFAPHCTISGKIGNPPVD